MRWSRFQEKSLQSGRKSSDNISMNEVLSQYYQRSPRYILLPQDLCLIRVAGPKQTPWEEGTEIRNISRTGLCFTAPDILLPRHGEYIRVQFDVPGAQAMACHAKVTRIEKIAEDLSLVAIEFDSLSPAQQWNISRGLKRKRPNEQSSVIDVRSQRDFPKWLEGIFFVSVGFSLFFSAFLLFSIFKFLADPYWMDKVTSVFEAAWSLLVR
jgi:hypothetical protein